MLINWAVAVKWRVCMWGEVVGILLRWQGLAMCIYHQPVLSGGIIKHWPLILATTSQQPPLPLYHDTRDNNHIVSNRAWLSACLPAYSLLASLARVEQGLRLNNQNNNMANQHQRLARHGQIKVKNIDNH